MHTNLEIPINDDFKVCYYSVIGIPQFIYIQFSFSLCDKDYIPTLCKKYVIIPAFRYCIDF